MLLLLSAVIVSLEINAQMSFTFSGGLEAEESTLPDGSTLVQLRSSNLIDWTHTAIDFPDKWPDRFDREPLTQVWAPQTIYDPKEEKYMVYYTIGESGTHYKIYNSHANADFTELTEPKLLYDHGANTIDADIVWHDDLYHMFFKTEGNGIQKTTAPPSPSPKQKRCACCCSGHECRLRV